MLLHINNTCILNMCIMDFNTWDIIILTGVTSCNKCNKNVSWYNPFLVYCRELAPGTVSLTGDRAQGDDSKHDSHYTCRTVLYEKSVFMTRTNMFILQEVNACVCVWSV